MALTPRHEQALLYAAQSEQALAYVGIAVGATIGEVVAFANGGVNTDVDV